MRIALSNRLYFPVVGGTPVLTRSLARAFVSHGHEVVLITATAGPANEDEEGFKLIRQPSTRELLDVADWADVLLQIEVSLNFLWPFLLRGKPFFVSHQTHFGQTWLSRLQRAVTRWGWPTSISQCVYQAWGSRGVIVPNPYDETIFKPGSENQRQELLFVGRLIESKGLVDLLQALAIMKNKNHLQPQLQVVGDEFENGVSVIPAFQQMTQELGLAEQVTFAGSRHQKEVAEEMRRSQILVVPSRWMEPFGIVALEGLASGCLVVASEQGGLRDAVGTFGHFFKNGDAESLAAVLSNVLEKADVLKPDPLVLQTHLDFHTADAIARRYETLFEKQILPPVLHNASPS